MLPEVVQSALSAIPGGVAGNAVYDVLKAILVRTSQNEKLLRLIASQPLRTGLRLAREACNFEPKTHNEERIYDERLAMATQELERALDMVQSGDARQEIQLALLICHTLRRPYGSGFAWARAIWADLRPVFAEQHTALAKRALDEYQGRIQYEVDHQPTHSRFLRLVRGEVIYEEVPTKPPEKVLEDAVAAATAALEQSPTEAQFKQLDQFIEALDSVMAKADFKDE